MKISFDWSESVPLDHADMEFIQYMLNRRMQGFHKYGHAMKQQDPVNGPKNIRKRLQKYRETRNTEFLIDAANYAWIEFQRPTYSNAFFEATPTEQSPGSESKR